MMLERDVNTNQQLDCRRYKAGNNQESNILKTLAAPHKSLTLSESNQCGGAPTGGEREAHIYEQMSDNVPIQVSYFYFMQCPCG